MTQLIALTLMSGAWAGEVRADREAPLIFADATLGVGDGGVQTGRLQVGWLVEGLESRLGLIAVVGQYHRRDPNALWTDTARGAGISVFLTGARAPVSVKIDATVEMHRVQVITARGVGVWEMPEPVLAPNVGVRVGPGAAFARLELLSGGLNPDIVPLAMLGYRWHVL